METKSQRFAAGALVGLVLTAIAFCAVDLYGSLAKVSLVYARAAALVTAAALFGAAHARGKKR